MVTICKITRWQNPAGHANSYCCYKLNIYYHKASRQKYKGEVCPRTGHESTEGELKYSSILSITLELDGGGWSTPRPDRLPPPPGKKRGTHCIGGWLGLVAGLNGYRKSRPPPGFDPRTVQPVANRYTDYAIHSRQKYCFLAISVFRWKREDKWVGIFA